MRFREVGVGEAFDFLETGWLGCIKTSARKYAYLHGRDYYEVSVGTVNVSVSNVRPAYGWELERMRESINGGQE